MKNYPLIEDQWRSFDVDVPKVDHTASSQPPSYHFTQNSADEMTSVSFLLTGIQRAQKSVRNQYEVMCKLCLINIYKAFLR